MYVTYLEHLLEMVKVPIGRLNRNENLNQLKSNIFEQNLCVGEGKNEGFHRTEGYREQVFRIRKLQVQ